MSEQRIRHSAPSANLADILERVLDKGIVVAGDITISLVGVELLNIRVRLLVASVDKAMQMGINWWEADPHLTTRANALEAENRLLRERLERLEHLLAAGMPDTPAVPPASPPAARPTPPPDEFSIP